MKKTVIYRLFLPLILFITLQNMIFTDTLSEEDGWYSVDSVIATVNSKPILKSQVEIRYNTLKNANKIKKKELKTARYKIIDEFIGEELLMQAAERESIIVSDEKVDRHITENLMPFYGIKDIKTFEKRVETKEKIPYSLYREQIRKQLIMELIMVYAMDFVPPTEGQAKEWYETNKKQLLQVKFQHILIKPKNDSFQSEKDANVEIEELKNRILSGESFGKLARQYSHDKTTARNNGYVDWIGFGELDPKLAYYVYQMNKKNSISDIFKSSDGYHIVKYHGRRYMPYDEVRDRIFQMLSQKARGEQFEAWVYSERHRSDVRVFLDGYYKYAKKNTNLTPQPEYIPMKNHERKENKQPFESQR